MNTPEMTFSDQFCGRVLSQAERLQVKAAQRQLRGLDVSVSIIGTDTVAFGRSPTGASKMVYYKKSLVSGLESLQITGFRLPFKCPICQFGCNARQI
jgi:hypothetical protein